MKLVLCDTNPAVTDALAASFDILKGGEANVGILRLDIMEAVRSFEPDSVVSPANSFGFMDGGIDAVYAKAWPGIGQLVRETIKAECKPWGELMVGRAAAVQIPRSTAPFCPTNLIVAPTMRLPGHVPAVNVFLAMRAAVLVARKVDTHILLCPGLGTATGGVPAGLAAALMRDGYDQAMAVTL